jgi:hypothetical protein
MRLRVWSSIQQRQQSIKSAIKRQKDQRCPHNSLNPEGGAELHSVIALKGSAVKPENLLYKKAKK